MASKKAPIGFDYVGIGTALSRNRLAVPLNQRDYSWEDEHVKTLFQDLSNAIDAHKGAYFLGTIVLTAGKRQDEAEVSDGQQRLATTMMFLAAVRDYFHEQKDEMLVNSIENSFLFTIVRETRRIVPRLTLNVNDHQFFEGRVLARPGSKGRTIVPTKESHEKIAAAANLAAKHVQSILRPHAEGNRTAVLNRWIAFVEDSAHAIVIKVPDELNAYVMFETLNARGLKTSQADLLKNYLFSQADDRLSEAQHKWAAMAGVMESLDIDDILITYLRHLTIARHGYTVERDVYERIKANTAGEGPAIEFLDALESNANDYAALIIPSHAKWNDYQPSIRKSVQAINELRMTPLRPLMLAVARQFDPKEAEKAFHLFVRWAVRFLIAGGGRSGSVEQAFAGAAVKVTKGEVTTTKGLVTEVGGVIPTDKEFESSFATARVSKDYLARYYLRAMERKLKNDPEAEWIPNDESVINLEHVLPENPGDNWPEVDPETAVAYYRRIGNMALMQAKKNTLIGNSPFSAKRPILRQSAYALTSEIAKKPSWGPDQINARQQRLAKLAVETWPLQI